MSDFFLRGLEITKDYGTLPILKGVSLDVFRGEALCIVGSSGAGKSTLLHILGTLDRPSSGSVWINGESIQSLDDAALANIRSREIGFVFQFHHLMKEFTALENVAMPLLIAGEAKNTAHQKALEWLSRVGMSHRSEHFPQQLSGGELQRVAIARALVHSPSILMADEPTGNLDSANALAIQELFFNLHKQWGLTLIVVTHDEQFAKRFPRILRMSDGHWAQI